MTDQRPVDAPTECSRVFGFSLTFFRNKGLRRLLASAGVVPLFGWPTAPDQVLIWGRANTAKRGQRIAKRTGAKLLTAEDGFLRSVDTGRQGDQPLSLILDEQGIYFDTGTPSDLSYLLENSAVLSKEEEQVYRDGITLLRDNNLSKYNDFPLECEALPDKFVLVIDQTLNDASIEYSGANAGTFQQMLDAALAENPNAKILIKTHPETHAGQRRGYFDQGDASDRVMLFSEPVSPWILFAQARAVYCVSSQMGMEAIFAGHRPVVFGRAFYSGLGLSDDRHPKAKLVGVRSGEQLFKACYLDYCAWYDPYLDAPADFEATANILATQANFKRRHSALQVFVGMRLWKRGFLRRFFRQAKKAPLFLDDVAKATAAAVRDGADVLVWSGKETPELAQACSENGLTLHRVEDGFLRSSGLGAELIEPVSLALDDLGIYYDPTRESRLERLISTSDELPEYALRRAAAVRRAMVEGGLSKYNLKSNMPKLEALSGQEIVLVPGQVEDDQSILKGADQVKTNLQLLEATRHAFPEAWIVYKPHPDVVAGLRNGGEMAQRANAIYDQLIVQADMAELLKHVDRVSTITSLTGFEALLRGKPVTCFGAPFYAGWGLTDDRGSVPTRRTARPVLDGLVHATLIEYPLYWDPVSGLPCPIETVLARFARGETRKSGRGPIRVLAKAQGLLASYAHLWR